MGSFKRVLAGAGTFVAVLALLLTGSIRSSAQDQATPSPVVVPVTPHPAAIHQGTCTQPVAEPAYDFGDVGPPTKEGGQPMAPEDIKGQITGPALLTSTAQMAFNMDDFLNSGQPAVVLVHESSQNFATILACGEIGGPVIDGTLTVGLRPINNSGFAGIAELDSDGDNTNGTIWMIPEVQSLSGGQQATPAAQGTPTPGATFAPTATATMGATTTPAAQQPTPAPAQPTATVAAPTPTPTGVAAPATTPTPG